MNFESQIKFLLSRYDFLDLSILTDHNLGNISESSIIITFDDGDISIYNNAFPILKKYNIPCIIFVVTDLLDTNKPFWWDEVEYYLGKEEGNKKNWEIKLWNNVERMAYLKKLRINSFKPPLEYNQLNYEQIQEMSESGIIIANHTHTHPILDQCTSYEIQNELDKSIGYLKERKFNPFIFAYPNGNYNEDVENILITNQIKLAFIFDHKINYRKVNPLRISRLIVNDSTPMWKYKLILSGYHSKLLPIIKYVNSKALRFNLR